jgi:SET domain-containing protein
MTKSSGTRSAKPRAKTSTKAAVQLKTAAKKAAKKVASRKKSAAALKKNSPRMGNAKAVVRVSAIHGRGVVARVALTAGERVCEYRGERIDWPEALRRHPHDPAQPFHTFYFSIDDDHVIDGNVDGDFSRFMNHSCEPNCEAETSDVRGVTRVFIQAMRDIKAGEELVYNYGLTLDERYTPTLKKQFACRCGSVKCRGTMLSPKR